MQAEYSPSLHGTLMVGRSQTPEDKATVQKVVFDITKMPIKNLTCRYRVSTNELLTVRFTLRNDSSENYGYVPEGTQAGDIQETSVNLPPYGYIRSVLFYGDPVIYEVERVVKQPNPDYDPQYKPEHKNEEYPDPRGVKFLKETRLVKVRDHYQCSGLALDIIP